VRLATRRVGEAVASRDCLLWRGNASAEALPLHNKQSRASVGSSAKKCFDTEGLAVAVTASSSCPCSDSSGCERQACCASFQLAAPAVAVELVTSRHVEEP
jgi:hypothetical protein